MKNKPYPLYDYPLIRDLKDLIDKRTLDEPDAVAFSWINKKNFISKSCKEFKHDVDAFGTYLLSLNYQNTHIAILGENSYEWIVSYFAVVNGGNIVIPLDKELSPEAANDLLKKSDCSVVICSDSYKDIFDTVELSKLICMSEIRNMIENGNSLINNGVHNFINYKIDTEKMCSIVFTSGTTGSSKGVMLSQKGITAVINNSCPNFRPEGGTLQLLPLHHMFGLVVSLMMVFNYRQPIFINSSLKNIKRDFQAAKPQTIFAVPLHMETLYKQIWEAAKKQGKTKTLKTAMKISNILLKLNIDIRKKLFASVREAFGGNLGYVGCGGASIDPFYIKEFRTFGVEILTAYGITECSPGISSNRNFHYRDGSVGLPVVNCEVKIADDGEIMFKGDNVFLGYYKDPEETKKSFRDGWYLTGDLGRIDKDGFLFVTGRKKNLIIRSNGENISPEELEAVLLREETVEEAMVYEENTAVIAEIFPKEEYMGNTEHFNKLLKEINSKLPFYKQISKIKLRDSEFEKNSSKKILRYKHKEAKND